MGDRPANNRTTKESNKTCEATASSSAAGETSLFSTIQTRNGHTKTIYGTNNTTEMLKSIPSSTVQNQLTDVLQAVRELDGTCDYSKCRTKTTLMSMDCEYCRQRYCFKHGLPEVHGCGTAVRRAEHQSFQHPKPQKQLNAEQDLRKAREKMQQKLTDMSVARKAKPVGSKTKKKK